MPATEQTRLGEEAGVLQRQATLYISNLQFKVKIVTEVGGETPGSPPWLAGWPRLLGEGPFSQACRPRDACLLFYCCALTVNCKEENRKMELGEKCRIDADLSPGIHAGCRVIAALGDILPVASPRQFPDFENIIQ